MQFLSRLFRSGPPPQLAQALLLQQREGMRRREIASHFGVSDAAVGKGVEQAMLGCIRRCRYDDSLVLDKCCPGNCPYARQQIDDDSLSQASAWFARLTRDDASEHDQQRWRSWLDQADIRRRAWARVEIVCMRLRAMSHEDIAAEFGAVFSKHDAQGA